MSYKLGIVPIKLLTTTLILILAFAGAAFAETQNVAKDDEPLHLKSYTVTANKVEEDAKDVSASISVIDGIELEEMGFANLRDLTTIVPNLGMQNFGGHYTEFNYRGIGGVTTMNKTWNINIDGVTIPYSAIDTLFDVERIEVMRGGQGSLYGRNTHAGVINIVTRQPSDEPTAELRTSYGSYNTRQLSGTINGPVNEKLKYRVSLKHEASDGYMESDVYDADDTHWSDQFRGSGKLLYQPNKDTDITLSFMADAYSGSSDAWVNLATDNKHTSTSNNQGEDDGSLTSGSVTVNHDFGTTTLTSITSYSNSRSEFGTDMDTTDFTVLDLTDYRETYNTLTQEIRLASNDKDSDLRWLSGLFFLSERIDYSTLMTAFTGLGWATDGSDSTIDTYGGAWFGQIEYDITPTLELEGTLRLDVERRDWEIQDVESNADHAEAHTWFAPLPSTTLTYKLTDDHRIYGSIARGYRSGDYVANETDLTNVDQGSHVVDPEYTLTYELGYKGAALDNRLRFNAAIFYIDWSDMQVTAVVDGAQVRDNAGRAHSYGAETEVSWLATRGLTLFANAGWLDAKFDTYEDHPTGDPSGLRIPNTNQYSFGGGARYTHDSGLFASAIITRFGDKYLDELNNIKQDPYSVATAKAGYKSDHWTVSVYGDNLFDEDYLVRAFELGAGMTPGIYGAPVSYGLELGCNFNF